MVLYKDFHFVRQRLLNLINRRHGTQLIYMELRGVVEKMDYEKLFLVLYDIEVMNAEVFAKEFEKCRLLTTFLGQNVENLDDYGCPKIQDLVETDTLWNCSKYPFRHKTMLQCAERKAKVYGKWAMQYLYILYEFIVFMFTTNLILSTRRDFFYSIHSEKFSLRNR